MYGREFILACDYEPIHWITYVGNPGARLLRGRLRLRDYQYKFEYKQGKLSRGVEALSGNPVLKESSGSSSESCKDSDDPVGPSQLSLVTKSNLGVSVSKKPGRARNPKQVLVIHDKPEAGTSKPASRSASSQRKPEGAKKAPTHILRPTRSIREKGSSTTGTLTSSTGSKPSVPRSITFKPTKSNTLGTQQDSTAVRNVPKQRGRPPGSVSAPFKTDSDEPYIPWVKINNPDPDESCIARRLFRRRGEIEPSKLPKGHKKPE